MAPDTPQSQDIKNTVKAKYDDETWLAVAKPLSDKLRESQKAALIAYILPRIGLDDTNRLFEYFLIDVDMSACMATSRILQAISSVQLFIQRCLMNLEMEVSPNAIDAKEWEWRKNYRVWEANRKVFLYPENWIEYDLLTTKSPFFKELEAGLLQNDLTDDSAESAYMNYLEKLDQVARLEICGVCQHTEPESSPGKGDQMNVFHVFGRTFHTPHIYFCRQLDIDKNVWSAWEQMQLDIEGDHLIPVVWNRTLHIFWPMFTAKETKYEQDKVQDPDRIHKHWEIKLAWSEYRNGKWSPKQISGGFVISKEEHQDMSGNVSDKDRSFIPKDQHFFKAVVDAAGNMMVKVFCQFLPYDPTYRQVFRIAEFQFSGCAGRVNVHYEKWYFENRELGDDEQMLLYEKFVDKSGPRDFMISPTNLELLEILNPENNIIENMTIKERADVKVLEMLSTADQLGSTPSRYRLVYPNDPDDFEAQAAFFYQDDRKTYYVTQRVGYDHISVISGTDKVRPNLGLDSGAKIYWKFPPDRVSPAVIWFHKNPSEKQFAANKTQASMATSSDGLSRILTSIDLNALSAKEGGNH
jgi:hypothetical protein